MPEKSTIATYAAGASLAAVTLVYVFGPTYFIDGGSNGQASNKRTRVVGLVNPANDCFINSVLQALAGLGDLRLFLIRETHRRNLDGPKIYTELAQESLEKGQAAWMVEGLQKGLVTKGLKDILDALNERPIYKKTISAAGFVKVLETAFRQRISRQQQDAQEFLQVVAERISDEYHAGHKARQQAWRDADVHSPDLPLEKAVDQRLERIISESEGVKPSESSQIASEDFERGMLEEMEEDGFPLEGKSESQIECLTCGFKPQASESTFCTLTLNVPQTSSTSLSACFDSMFKTEYIEDFKCEKCRLVHAMENYQRELEFTKSESHKEACREAIEKLRQAIDVNPEDPPLDVSLPDSKMSPKRKIARHIRITKFPKTLAIHLSRSIFDAGNFSSKNSAKVAFPETLPLGSILSQKKYKLLAVVCHKGSHNSGHYESFRRQSVVLPFSTPNTFDKLGVYSTSKPSTSVSTPVIRPAASPESGPAHSPEQGSQLSHSSSSLSLPGPSTPNKAPTDTESSIHKLHTPNSQDSLTVRSTSGSSLKSIKRTAQKTLHKVESTVSLSSSRIHKTSSTSGTVTGTYNGSKEDLSTIASKTKKRHSKPSEKWWRISDDKVKESKTSEVLHMQKEVYLLFYELIRD